MFAARRVAAGHAGRAAPTTTRAFIVTRKRTPRLADNRINEKEEFLLAATASSLPNRGSTFREADPHLWPSAAAML